MRRSHRRLIGIGVGMVSAVSVLAGTTASVVAGAAPHPEVAQQPPAAEASVATTLFSTLGQQVSGAVINDLVGWGLSSIGLSAGDDESAELAQINSELNEIIDELSTIEQELAQLTAAIEQLDCDSLASSTLPARQLIDSLSTTYQEFVDTAAGTFNNGNGVVPPISDMTSWAESVTDPTSGVFAQIAAINDALLPAGSAQGILQACLQPGVIAPPAPWTIDDQPYYDQVQNLTNFWYLYQARGLLLVQEAEHFLAQQASGQTGDPTDPGDICTSATDAQVVTLCTAAIEDTNSVYMLLSQQLTLAGAPYSNDNIVSNQAPVGYPSVIWVRSLEDFTQSNGGGCTYPLTSFDPCGITVGNHSTAGDAFGVTYMGYDTWRPADADNLTKLIEEKPNNLFPGQYLQDQGFANMYEKVVITKETFSFTIWSNVDTDFTKATGTGVCFLEMYNTGVVCSDDDLNNPYVGYVGVVGNCNDHWVTGAYIYSLPNVPFDNYRLYPPQCRSGGEWDPSPGWLLSADNYNATGVGATSDQFRWPVIRVDSLSCTQGRSAQNPGGVYTRCGTDFDSWFNEQVPRPVTCAGTIVGVCGDQVSVALTGSETGEWASPVASGDVSVAFGNQAVRRITGTVQLPATDGAGSAAVTFQIARAGGRNDFYIGRVKIRADGQRTVVVPLRRAELEQHADGTVSGQVTGRHGSYTLTLSVLDNPD